MTEFLPLLLQTLGVVAYRFMIFSQLPRSFYPPVPLMIVYFSHNKNTNLHIFKKLPTHNSLKRSDVQKYKVIIPQCHNTHIIKCTENVKNHKNSLCIKYMWRRNSNLSAKVFRGQLQGKRFGRSNQWHYTLLYMYLRITGGGNGRGGTYDATTYNFSPWGDERARDSGPCAPLYRRVHPFKICRELKPIAVTLIEILAVRKMFCARIHNNKGQSVGGYIIL